MNIQREAGGSLRVELTEEELHSFQLSYGQLNYRDTKTRRLLKTLLEGAGAITGFCRHPDRLMIEVFPAPNKGCVLYFTPLSGKKRYRQQAPCAYAFASCESLLGAIAQIGAVSKEVYRLQERYVLILHRVVAAPLEEYGDRLPATRLHLAYIREHGIPLDNGTGT